MTALVAEPIVRAVDRPESEYQDQVTVAAKRSVAQGVVEISLVGLDGPLPGWEAGSHIDLVLGADLTRQYSLCGPTDEHGKWRVAVLREPESRGGSRFVHDNLTVGSIASVKGPRNNFPLLDAAAYLFVAGGVGITPILAMIRQAQADGKPWRLLYGGRTSESMAYVDVLRALAVAEPDRVLVRPQDEFGLLDLEGFLGDIAPGVQVYCCGPEPLIQAVESRSAAWPAGTLQTERFAARADLLDAPSETFEVELARSGDTLQIGADQSILDALHEAGIDVGSSCHEGICGSCETNVLEGEVDHRDSLLTPAERDANDVMFVCVSRCLSKRLVLDL